MSSEESRNDSLNQLRTANVPRGVSTAHPIFVARTDGSRLWDADGNEYIDFAGGIGVLNVGHNHPRVVQAVKAQLERVTHTAFQVAMYEPYIRLAERLNDLAPGSDPKKTILFTTGVEAVENAIKVARAFTGRTAIVSFTNSFHGRTLLGMSLTGKAAPYKQNFGPYASEVYHSPFPYAYRGWSTDKALAALHDLFDTDISPKQVAAIIIEPVLGEGGFVPAPADFLQGLRQLADDHGILLIADEIQCGMGRTGRMFAIENSGVVPDLITVAKSLAAGLPLSGVIGRADIMDAPAPGGLGGTYAGNPVACAAALAVLDIFDSEHLLERGQRLGQILKDRFTEWQGRYDVIGDVRALGPMAALEFVKDRASKEPGTEQVDGVLRYGREHGLILLKAGLYNNVIRTLMPLNTPDETLEEGLRILEDGIAQANRVLMPAAVAVTGE